MISFTSMFVTIQFDYNHVFFYYEFCSAHLKYNILILINLLRKHELWNKQKSPWKLFCVTHYF